MATNKSMIEALERMIKLIEQINERTEELNAWKDVLKKHITAQEKQHGQDWNDYYKYDKKKKRCVRAYR